MESVGEVVGNGTNERRTSVDHKVQYKYSFYNMIGDISGLNFRYPQPSVWGFYT